jgi:hypothetical protein
VYNVEQLIHNMWATFIFRLKKEIFCYTLYA